MSRTVLVTVGSTKFDDLIRAVDSQPFADELVAQGYNKLIMQAIRTLSGALKSRISSTLLGLYFVYTLHLHGLAGLFSLSV